MFITIPQLIRAVVHYIFKKPLFNISRTQGNNNESVSEEYAKQEYSKILAFCKRVDNH